MAGTSVPRSHDTPRLFRPILPVTTIDRAERFYSRLLALPGVRGTSRRHHFDCAGTIRVCFDPRADTDNFGLGPNPDHLYFAARDLEGAFARLVDLNPEILDPNRDRPWGERSFYRDDPYGNKLCSVDQSTLFLGRVPFRMPGWGVPRAQMGESPPLLR
jgi:catechol 2,3-dioxygenase-like lactoylglutathione lyase family enzyme